MHISKYLDERLVIFLEEQTREDVISLMVDLLHREKKIEDKEQFLQAILEREKIVSTGIGIEVAIPHAKVPGKSEFFIAVGIQRGKGVDWKALDGSLVRLVFMIGGPDNRQTEYLKLLSGLTMILKEEERRKQLLKCRTGKEVIDLFMGC